MGGGDSRPGTVQDTVTPRFQFKVSTWARSLTNSSSKDDAAHSEGGKTPRPEAESESGRDGEGGRGRHRHTDASGHATAVTAATTAATAASGYNPHESDGSSASPVLAKCAAEARLPAPGQQSLYNLERHVGLTHSTSEPPIPFPRLLSLSLAPSRSSEVAGRSARHTALGIPARCCAAAASDAGTPRGRETAGAKHWCKTPKMRPTHNMARLQPAWMAAGGAGLDDEVGGGGATTSILGGLLEGATSLWNAATRGADASNVPTHFSSRSAGGDAPLPAAAHGGAAPPAQVLRASPSPPGSMQGNPPALASEPGAGADGGRAVSVEGEGRARARDRSRGTGRWGVTLEIPEIAGAGGSRGAGRMRVVQPGSAESGDLEAGGAAARSLMGCDRRGADGRWWAWSDVRSMYCRHRRAVIASRCVARVRVARCLVLARRLSDPGTMQCTRIRGHRLPGGLSGLDLATVLVIQCMPLQRQSGTMGKSLEGN